MTAKQLRFLVRDNGERLPGAGGPARTCYLIRQSATAGRASLLYDTLPVKRAEELAEWFESVGVKIEREDCSELAGPLAPEE